MNYIQKSTIRELKHMILNEKGSAFGVQCERELAARRAAIRKTIINNLPSIFAGLMTSFIIGMCIYYVFQLSFLIVKSAM